MPIGQRPVNALWEVSMSVMGIHHISLIVADTGRALGFYRDILGLPVIVRPELGFPGAWLGVGALQIHLLELPNPDPVDGRPGHVGRDRHLALAVDDWDAMLQQLAAHGIDYQASRSGRKAVFCRDPDGNGIELIATT